MAYLSRRDDIPFHSSMTSSQISDTIDSDRSLFLSERDGPRPIIIPADGTPGILSSP